MPRYSKPLFIVAIILFALFAIIMTITFVLGYDDSAEYNLVFILVMSNIVGWGLSSIFLVSLINYERAWQKIKPWLDDAIQISAYSSIVEQEKHALVF